MRVEIDGVALRLARTLADRSTTSLAAAVGVTPAAICHIEKGRRASVSATVYAALVAELGIDARPDWICPVLTDVMAGTPDGSSSRLPSRSPSGIVRGASSSTTEHAAA